MQYIKQITNGLTGLLAKSDEASLNPEEEQNQPQTDSKDKPQMSEIPLKKRPYMSATNGDKPAENDQSSSSNAPESVDDPSNPSSTRENQLKRLNNRIDKFIKDTSPKKSPKKASFKWTPGKGNTSKLRDIIFEALSELLSATSVEICDWIEDVHPEFVESSPAQSWRNSVRGQLSSGDGDLWLSSGRPFIYFLNPNSPTLLKKIASENGEDSATEEDQDKNATPPPPKKKRGRPSKKELAERAALAAESAQQAAQSLAFLGDLLLRNSNNNNNDNTNNDENANSNNNNNSNENGAAPSESSSAPAVNPPKKRRGNDTANNSNDTSTTTTTTTTSNKEGKEDNHDDMEEDDDVESEVESVDAEGCAECGQPGKLIICDGCEAEYHLPCVNLQRVPRGKWFCPSCSAENANNADNEAASSNKEQVVHKPNPALVLPELQPVDVQEVTVSDEVLNQLKAVYRIYKKESDLLFGVDKDLDKLPEKRRKNKPEYISGQEALLRKNNDDPDSVSAGYGEMTLGSFKHIITFLQSLRDQNLRLDQNSRFLDIGSGFGRCVVHAKIQAKVAVSEGIEYVPVRYRKSVHILADLNLRAAELGLNLEGVTFTEGDATKSPSFEHTHIYCYDYIFSPQTHAALVPILDKSPFKVLVCFSPPAKLNKYGATTFELFHKQSLRTSGNQTFSIYFYKKKPMSVPWVIKT